MPVRPHLLSLLGLEQLFALDDLFGTEPPDEYAHTVATTWTLALERADEQAPGGQQPKRVDEVEVGGRDFAQFMAQISNQRYAFKKNFR